MTAERTISDWINQVRDAFATAGLHFGHGTDNAGDEAAWLVLHAAGAPLDGSFEDWEMQVDEEAAREIERLADLRCKTAMPLAYLLGRAWFAGLEFYVQFVVTWIIIILAVWLDIATKRGKLWSPIA